MGAVSVHGLCGAWGTLMTGVFAKKSGLIYSGSPKDLLIQLAGVLSVAAWSAAYYGDSVHSDKENNGSES